MTKNNTHNPSEAEIAEYDCFISYAPIDVDQAIKLTESLESYGITFWMPVRKKGNDAGYSNEIDKAMTRSKSVIVILSVDSIASLSVENDVVHADKLGKFIYPVKMSELDMTSGLSYYLSAMQAINLYGFTSESISRLIKAISTDLKLDASSKASVLYSEETNKIINSKNNNISTNTILAHISILLMLTLLVFMGSKYLQFRQNRVAIENDLDQYSKLPPLPSSLEIKQKVKDDVSKVRMQKDLEVVADFEPELLFSFEEYTNLILVKAANTNDLPKGYILNSSVDGTVFSPLLYQRYIDTNAKILLFNVTDKAGTIKAEYDMYDEFRVFTKNEIDLLKIDIKQNIKKHVGCNMFECPFKESKDVTKWLCHPMVSAAKLKYKGNNYEIDLSKCLTQNPIDDVNIRTLNRIFGLTNRSHLDFELNFIDGSAFTERLSVRFGRKGTQREHNWVMLEPVEDTIYKDAPNGFATFKHSNSYKHNGNGSFSFTLALSQESISEVNILIDPDGKGLVDPGGPRSWNHERTFSYDIYTTDYISKRDFLYYFDLNDKTIILGVEDEFGGVQGPWKYSIDYFDIAKEAFMNNEKPKIHCRSECTPVSSSAFLDVEHVEFGQSHERYTHLIPINYVVKDILSGECTRRTMNECLPFLFEVPRGWSDIYYRIKLKNNTFIKERVIRP